MIEIRHVYQRLNRYAYSLSDIDLTISECDHIILRCDDDAVGTLLFRLLCHIDRVTEGDILYDGVSIAKARLKNLDICYVPREPIYFANKSVMYNLSYSQKIRKSLDSSIIRDILSEYNLLHLADTKCRDLSAEELDKVMFLKSIVRDVKVLLIDNIFDKTNNIDFYIDIINKFDNKIVIINTNNQKIIDKLNKNNKYKILSINNSILSKNA